MFFLLKQSEHIAEVYAAMTGEKRNRTTRNSTKTHAVGYLRTSSAANVGTEKDSDKRQRAAIQRYCKAVGFLIDDADWYYDEAVSGADPLGTRPGWSALMARITSNGVRTVIIEDASRFARELMVQEQGILELRQAGVTVLTAGGDDLTASNDPGRTMIRQIMGSFSEYEKARLVAKLRGARDRKIAETGRCGGRRKLSELNPDALKLARKLRRANPLNGKRMSFRDIALKLAAAGHVAASGKPLSPSVVKRLLGQ
ncbi:Site-specific recombinase [Hyphomicrobium sulfonivorans]|uniref:Site-specific recombinase n=1 Tax=Hyphomicrobium sulfonivorans TaxID=121290 RepID=A0A125NUS0_HYPSL|nr:recombinase family protein [Hyphomicrobium sulfonivorans]KWT67510.1 Site-specific recombinase [Hyphomicrobium sulfonivorans]